MDNLIELFHQIKKMDSGSKIPVISSLGIPQCRYMIYWTLPFSMAISTPLALVFSYYNSQNQQHITKWKVKALGKDLILFWGCFALYGVVRTIILDPYCDPNSVHYNKALNAFDRKKLAVEGMREVLKAEGKAKPETQNKQND